MKDFEILEIEYMITAELTRKINLLPQESYSMVENFVEQLIDANKLLKLPYQSEKQLKRVI